jgi:hypothetical protein
MFLSRTTASNCTRNQSKNQTQRACNSSVENKGVEQPNSSARMGACPVPTAAMVLRSERRRRLVRSPDSSGNGRREERKGISEGLGRFVAGEGSNHHDLHDLQSRSTETTGGCTHPTRGYAEPRVGRHDVVCKKAAGVASPQLGAATDAELRLARRDVIRKESIAEAAENWDPWPARRHLDGGKRMGSMAAGRGEQARDPW